MQTSNSRLGLRFCLSLVLSTIAAAAVALEPPVWHGDIGYQRYPDFFATDIGVDAAGNVIITDVARETVFSYAADGSLNYSAGMPNRFFTRGVVVDSQGVAYIGGNLSDDIQVYAPTGQLIDVWPGVGGGGHGDVAPNGNIFLGVVTEVVVFDNTGQELWRFGEEGTGPGQFRDVSDVTVAPDNSIWVADKKQNRISKFDSQGQFLFTVGTSGGGDGQFRNPVAIAADSVGNVYVSDRRNYRIQKFDPDGNFLLTWGSMGTGPGQFLESHGLDVGPDDTVWVAGFHTFSVQQFDGDGQLLSFWQGNISGPGEFTTIRGIGVRDGVLFANDYWNNRVQVFNAYTGKYLYGFGERGQGDSTVFNYPRGLGIGPDGHLYIPDDGHTRRIMPDGTFVDRYSFREQTGGAIIGAQGIDLTDNGIMFQANYGRHTMFKIDTNSSLLLAEWGQLGNAPGEFNRPAGVALGPDGNVWIAEQMNARVQVLDQDGNFLYFFGPTIQGAHGLHIDDERDRVYVGSSGRLDALDFSGNTLVSWGSTGSGPGEFANLVTDVVVDENGVIFAADQGNGRIQRFVYPTADTPSAAGQPIYQAGDDLGVYVWQRRDGSHSLRISGDGRTTEFQVEILATEAVLKYTPFGLEGDDDLAVAGSTIVLTSRMTEGTGEFHDGVDFQLPRGSRALVAIRQDGVVRHGLLRSGGAGDTVPVSGWILPAAELATRPDYQPGAALGLTIGWDEPGDLIEARLSGAGTSVYVSVVLLSGSPLSSVQAQNVEPCCDVLTQTEYSVQLDAQLSTWWDGVDVGLEQSGGLVGLVYTESGRFAAHQVNESVVEDFGIPNAHWLPTGSRKPGRPLQRGERFRKRGR